MGRQEFLCSWFSAGQEFSHSSRFGVDMDGRLLSLLYSLDYPTRLARLCFCFTARFWLPVLLVLTKSGISQCCADWDFTGISCSSLLLAISHDRSQQPHRNSNPRQDGQRLIVSTRQCRPLESIRQADPSTPSTMCRTVRPENRSACFPSACSVTGDAFRVGMPSLAKFACDDCCS